MHKPHKNLEVWKKSMEFVEKVYEVTATFPKEEMYGLVSQVRRSAVSIPANIAEGAARKGVAEFNQFIHIALGSSSELDTELEISQRLGYIPDATWRELDDRLVEIDRMLIGLKKSLAAKREVRG